MYILIIYCIISLVIGIADTVKLVKQAKYFASVPMGDIGYYVSPKKILGIHNWVFLPSWAIVLIGMLIF